MRPLQCQQHNSLSLCPSQDGGADLNSWRHKELRGKLQCCTRGLPDHPCAWGAAGETGGAHRRPATVALQRQTDSQRGQETQTRWTAGLNGAELTDVSDNRRKMWGDHMNFQPMTVQLQDHSVCRSRGQYAASWWTSHWSCRSFSSVIVCPVFESGVIFCPPCHFSLFTHQRVFKQIL